MSYLHHMPNSTRAHTVSNQVYLYPVTDYNLRHRTFVSSTYEGLCPISLLWKLREFKKQSTRSLQSNIVLFHSQSSMT